MSTNYFVFYQNLWQSLLTDRNTNYFAVLVKPMTTIMNDNIGRLDFDAIAVIADRRNPGFHILMFDEIIRHRGGDIIDSLTDLTDVPPRNYMANHFGAIAQMCMRPARSRVIPVHSIRYGDAKLGPRRTPAAERAAQGILGEIGLTKALVWLKRMFGEENEPLRQLDPRVCGLQNSSLASMDLITGHGREAEWGKTVSL